MGVENSGVLYALWGLSAQASDELSFREGDMVTILQKPEGVDWWWASLCGREGFVPNNYFGVRMEHTDNKAQSLSSAFLSLCLVAGLAALYIPLLNHVTAHEITQITAKLAAVFTVPVFRQFFI